nr:retrovirus-related Pol polyprotein from transposon TNT 1-94 [Tanacetum cinerariifolium]
MLLQNRRCRRDGKVEVRFDNFGGSGEEIVNYGGKGRRGSSIFGRGGGSLAICSMESKGDLGGGLVVVGGSWVGAGGGEVKVGDVDLGVTKSFLGKKPSLEYFKVFGSKCFILNTKDCLTKFDPKSTEGIFLGYSPNSKAYVILNRETMRVEESLNVKFNKISTPETPPLEDDDVLKNKNIERQEKDLEIKENEPLNKEIPNIKESKDHPLETVIGTRMPSEYQQDYKKTRAYALKNYNDPNMSDALSNIYRTLESRYVHEWRTINISFYNDLSDDSVAKFTAIGIYIYSDAWGLDELEKTLEKIKPYNSRLPALDDIQNLIYRRIVHEKIDKERNTIHKLPNHIETNELFNHLRPYNPSTLPTSSLGECTSLETERTKFYLMEMSFLKAKQPKKPPPKRTRNVGKSKRTQLSTSSSTESPASDNGEFPSTKLSPWSYSGALKDDPNMSKEQRRQEGCSKT